MCRIFREKQVFTEKHQKGLFWASFLHQFRALFRTKHHSWKCTKTALFRTNQEIHKTAKNGILGHLPTNLTGRNSKWHFKGILGTSPHMTTGTRNGAKKRLFKAKSRAPENTTKWLKRGYFYRQVFRAQELTLQRGYVV